MSDLDDVDIESLRWLRTFVDAGTEPHDGAAGRALGLIVG